MERTPRRVVSSMNSRFSSFSRPTSAARPQHQHQIHQLQQECYPHHPNNPSYNSSGDSQQPPPKQQQQFPTKMPIVFDASAKKKGRGLAMDFVDGVPNSQTTTTNPRHPQQYQGDIVGARNINSHHNHQQQQLHQNQNQSPSQHPLEDRERMKEMLADSFSRNETISILPGFKEEPKAQVKPCIKLGHSNSHTMSLALGDKPPYAYNNNNNQQSQSSNQWKQHQFNGGVIPGMNMNGQNHNQNQNQNQFNSYTSPYAYHQQQQNRTTSSSSDPRHEAKFWEHHDENNNHHNSMDEPWPYGQQKSQRSIRAAQAAYKRDLDRQIEEKKQSQCRDRNINNAISSQPKSNNGNNNIINNTNPVNLEHNHNHHHHHHNSGNGGKQINQSVSLEAFRNTGFLPAWFDPVKNNTLYSNNGGSPELPQDQPSVGPPLEPSFEMQCDLNGNKGGIPVSTPCPIDISQIPILNSPRANNNNNNSGSNNNGDAFLPGACPSGNYYIVSQEVINQITQNQSLSIPIQPLTIPPIVPPPPPSTLTPLQPAPTPTNINNLQQQTPTQPQMQPQQQQQNIWTPWLNSPAGIPPLPPSKPPPQPPQHTSMKSASTSYADLSLGQNQGQGQSSLATVLEHPIVKTPGQFSDAEDHQLTLPDEPGQYNKSAGVSPRYQQSQITLTDQISEPPDFSPGINETGDHLFIQQLQQQQQTEQEQIILQQQLVNEDQDYDQLQSPVTGQSSLDNGEFPGIIPAPHVSQTASQRPDEELMKTRYKSQLAKQIEEKRRLEQERLTKQIEDDAKFQKKIEDDQKRMIEEYEEEQRLHKLRQEEYKKRQDIILKEKERFDREAEELRNKKKLEKRRTRERAQTPTKENPSMPNYESPIDLTICAASAWQSKERAKTPRKPETSGSNSNRSEEYRQVWEQQEPGPLTSTLTLATEEVKLVQSTNGGENGASKVNMDTPRPRTVVISHHRASIGTERQPQQHQLEQQQQYQLHQSINQHQRQQLERRSCFNPFDTKLQNLNRLNKNMNNHNIKVNSYNNNNNHRVSTTTGNTFKNYEESPGASSSDASFLADIRHAIIAEDNRIREIIKKKERLFVTF